MKSCDGCCEVITGQVVQVQDEFYCEYCFPHVGLPPAGFIINDVKGNPQFVGDSNECIDYLSNKRDEHNALRWAFEDHFVEVSTRDHNRFVEALELLFNGEDCEWTPWVVYEDYTPDLLADFVSDARDVYLARMKEVR